MTLIAGIRCAGGVVLCADSQETIDVPDRGQYRVQVNKIAPQDAGYYEVVIGGSGDAALVDGFTDSFVEHVSDWQELLSGSEIKSKIRTLLHDYHRNEVALSAAFDDDKYLTFLICLKPKTGNMVHLWKALGPTIREVNDLTLLGWEEPMYWREASRLYSADLRLSEGILLGVHLFSSAKETSNVISGNTRIIVVRESGMYVMAEAEVEELEQRVKLFADMSDTLLLAMPDVTVTPEELEEYLNAFKTAATHLHDQFFVAIHQLQAQRFLALPEDAFKHEGDSAELTRLIDDPYIQMPTLERLLRTQGKSTRKAVRSLRILSLSPPGSSSERRQWAIDLVDAKELLEQAATLNQTLYDIGEYGSREDIEVIAKWQKITNSIDSSITELAAIEKLIGV